MSVDLGIGMGIGEPGWAGFALMISDSETSGNISTFSAGLRTEAGTASHQGWGNMQRGGLGFVHPQSQQKVHLKETVPLNCPYLDTRVPTPRHARLPSPPSW